MRRYVHVCIQAAASIGNGVLVWILFFVFFFQAEDGIRDDLVTGVQTCALPISFRFPRRLIVNPLMLAMELILGWTSSTAAETEGKRDATDRASELRRVGDGSRVGLRPNPGKAAPPSGLVPERSG